MDNNTFYADQTYFPPDYFNGNYDWEGGLKWEVSEIIDSATEFSESIMLGPDFANSETFKKLMALGFKPDLADYILNKIEQQYPQIRSNCANLSVVDIRPVRT